MSAIIEQLNAHPRLSKVRAAFHEFFDRDDVRVRAIVSDEGWSDRVITWATITNELWESDYAALVIAQVLIDRAEGITAEQGYTHCDLCGREFGSDGYCDCVSKAPGLAK